jgi:hypothetical protein
MSVGAEQVFVPHDRLTALVEPEGPASACAVSCVRGGVEDTCPLRGGRCGTRRWFASHRSGMLHSAGSERRILPVECVTICRLVPSELVR